MRVIYCVIYKYLYLDAVCSHLLYVFKNVSFLYEMAGRIMVPKASCFVTLFVMLNEALTLQELYQHYSH
jgi:hypothetical protein